MPVALWFALVAGVSFESDSGCPSAASVLHELKQLLPRALREDRSHRAALARTDGALALELLSAEGVLLAQKTVSMPGATCAEQSRAIAVLLAAWETDLQLQRSAVPELPRPPLVASGDAGPSLVTAHTLTPAAEFPLGSDHAGTPAVTPPTSPPTEKTAPPPTDPQLEVMPVERAAAPGGLSLVVGGGPLATVENGQLSLGGLGRLALGAAESPWLVVVELSGLGQHSEALGDGTALWSRFSAGLGGGARLRWRAFFAEAYVLFDGALIQLSGQGFKPDAPSTSDLDLGVSAALRLGAMLGPLRPWLGFRADLWLRGQEVSAPPLAKAQQLPMMELIPALGMDFELL